MDQYSALHLRQSPNLRKAIADAMDNDQILFGCCIGIPSEEVCKVVAATNVDWAFLDAEHTPMSPTLMASMIHTLKLHSGGRVVPIVRVPSHGHEWVGWALDAGAGGVVIPHSETAEQVRASIAAARFPPQGHRSYPPFAFLPGAQQAAPEGKTWMNVASEHCAVIPQIESGLGVENLEEIMQIEGVDAIMVGPMDLSLDLGGDPKRVAEAMARIESLSSKYRMPLLGFAAEHLIVDKFKAGYRLMANLADVWILQSGIDEGYKRGKELIESYQKEQRKGLPN